MKYPYIGQCYSVFVLFYDDGEGLVLGDALGIDENTKVGDKVKLNGGTNITTEYLANTYGEVESKEHAEFIVKLAEVNGFDIGIKSNTPSVFEFSGMLLNMYANDISSFAHNVESKIITIPLPPECEGVDEWPVVGEIVLTASKSKAKVLATHNKKARVEYVSGANGFNTLNIASLSKPKTPEQELLDEISDLAFNQFNDDSYDLTHNAYYLAEKLISKYDIEKKPQ